MKKVHKVFLHPGEVRSRKDGDRHFISGIELIRLYGVLPTDEIKTFDRRDVTHSEEYQKMRGIYAFHLYPDAEGKYENIHQFDEKGIIIPKKYLKI